MKPDLASFELLRHAVLALAATEIKALLQAGLGSGQGHVVSVEANRPVHALLCENLKQNGVGNVTPFHIAIGERNGRAFFNEASAYGHLASAGTPVTMLTPETLLTRSGGRLPDFIKIDCEGFEPFILKSAADLIWRSNAIVHFEFNTWCLLHHSRSHPLEFLEWVSDTFPETHILREGGTLERFGRSDVAAILHDNMLKYGCVHHLVVSFEPARLT